MKYKIKWVWVDCFTKLTLNTNKSELLKNAGFKLCLVSPELQGRQEDLLLYKVKVRKQNLNFDAVCTKHPEKWK